MKDKVLIVIYVGTFDDNEYIDKVKDLITNTYKAYYEAGIIQMISAPPKSLFPNLNVKEINKKNKIKKDSDQRFYWRSKQNLDYSLLMAYCQDKGAYYIQLEDDILTIPNYVEIILAYINEKNVRHPGWFLINFCHLGFIGKTFPTNQLTGMFEFFARKYNQQPVDWLLPSYITKNRKHKYSRKQSLFQHIGINSSLEGKKQKLKDNSFK